MLDQVDQVMICAACQVDTIKTERLLQVVLPVLLGSLGCIHHLQMRADDVDPGTVDATYLAQCGLAEICYATTDTPKVSLLVIA